MHSLNHHIGCAKPPYWMRLVSRPTRWSLWYWYLDVYVDHLYISKSKWQRNIVKQMCWDAPGQQPVAPQPLGLWKCCQGKSWSLYLYFAYKSACSWVRAILKAPGSAKVKLWCFKGIVNPTDIHGRGLIFLRGYPPIDGKRSKRSPLGWSWGPWWCQLSSLPPSTESLGSRSRAGSETLTSWKEVKSQSKIIP